MLSPISGCMLMALEMHTALPGGRTPEGNFSGGSLSYPNETKEGRERPAGLAETLCSLISLQG